jgi:hypothetical protein
MGSGNAVDRAVIEQTRLPNVWVLLQVVARRPRQGKQAVRRGASGRQGSGRVQREGKAA